MSIAPSAPPHQTVAHHGVLRVGMPFPPDSRQRVQQTAQAPWSAIGLVSATMPSGAVLEATGFVIDSRHVVTVAHAVFDTEEGGDARSVAFECARNAAQTPFGRVAVRRWHKPVEYPTGGRPYDYCVLELGTALPSEVGRYRLVAATDQQLTGPEFQIAGYPDDKAPENSMWSDDGRLLGPPDTRILRYRISTAAGQSGAAVSSYLEVGTTDVVGIHAGRAPDASCNEAVRMTQGIIDQIQAWRAG